jgi:hypothetical protein
MNDLDVGSYVDLRYLNKPAISRRTKVTNQLKFMAIALDNSGTHFTFKPARSIPVTFA